MVSGGDNDPLLVKQRLGLQAGLDHRRVHDGHVQVAVQYPRGQRSRRGLDQHGTQGRMAFGQAAEQRTGHPPAGGADATDADFAGHLVAHGHNVVVDGLELGSDSSGPLEDGPPFGGGLHGVPVD